MTAYLVVSCYHGNTRSWCGELLLMVVLRVRSHVWSRSDRIYIYGKFVVHYMCFCSKKSFKVFIFKTGDKV